MKAGSTMPSKELRERIGNLTYAVTQNAATERPFTGECIIIRLQMLEGQ